MAKILIVEDDSETSALMQEWLTQVDHHTVEVLNNGDNALEALRLNIYDVVILDWQVPGKNGPEVCREFRRTGGNTPVLMITAKDSISDKEHGYYQGVDDYLTKPFHLKELSLRVTALLKRPPVYSSVLEAGQLSLDLDSRRVSKKGQDVILTPREFAVLEFLMRHRKKIFTASELLNNVWEAEASAGTEALRQCIKRLREKIDTPGEPSLIENIPRKGYTIS